MKTNPNDTVTPFDPQNAQYNQGLTKREYFAAMAMQGLLSGADYAAPLSDLIEQSLRVADALIEGLNKQGGAQ